MIKGFITFSLLLVLIKFKLIGQDLPPIQLGRPDQTECSFIVPIGFIQAENGFTYEYK